MLKMIDNNNLKDIYNFQLGFETPYFFKVDYETWKKSFTEDIDGEGRTMFAMLNVKAFYENDELVGFVQYGNTAFGFDENGEISSDVSYAVICISKKAEVMLVISF